MNTSLGTESSIIIACVGRFSEKMALIELSPVPLIVRKFLSVKDRVFNYGYVSYSVWME